MRYGLYYKGDLIAEWGKLDTSYGPGDFLENHVPVERLSDFIIAPEGKDGKLPLLLRNRKQTIEVER